MWLWGNSGEQIVNDGRSGYAGAGERLETFRVTDSGSHSP